MNIYLILSTTIVGLICFILGLVVEHFIDSGIIGALRSRIWELRRELVATRKERDFFKNTRQVKFVELTSVDNPAVGVQFDNSLRAHKGGKVV